ncbi:hypothetical protein QE152_g35304 [Popillia japonica]|uniref:Uncharacterized protein n=1 Tax=Popillia japonica TaxID=7064 RepID=A0AAW1IG31_POPJA
MADKERIYCVDNKFYKIKVSDEIHTLFLNDHEVLQNYIKQNICASDDNCNKSNKFYQRTRIHMGQKQYAAVSGELEVAGGRFPKPKT